MEAEVGGRTLGELRARMPLPLTNPKVLLLYKDPDDPLVVEDWTLLDEESRLAVLKHLVKEHGFALARLVGAFPLSRFAVNVVVESEEGRVEVDVPIGNLLSLDGALAVVTPNKVYLAEPSISSGDAVWRAEALASTPPSPFGAYGVGQLVKALERVSSLRPQS